VTTPQPPAWFRAAMACPAEEGSVVADGARIRYRAWGDRGMPGVVLVHGTAAHAHWWDHVGPQLPAGLRVVALDLSGHGDSEWREDYSLERWAREIMAVAPDAGIAGPPFIVGHSLGGIIALDSPEFEKSAEFERSPGPERKLMTFGGARTYPSREAVLARFRLVPEQPVLPYIREHVAVCSITTRENGEWAWKFDRRLLASMTPFPPVTAPVACPVTVLRAENGLMTPDMADLLYARLGGKARVVEIPAAGHHVMLDEPLCLVTALRTVLADWHHPAPSRPKPDIS
jgi:pimeloyl-ACP methyl ester carboxylesterase